MCYSLTKEVRMASECISNTVWIVLVKKHLEKKGVWMQESKANRFCIFVFAVLDSWNFRRGSRLFLSQIFDPFTVANEVKFIGKDLVVWRDQGCNHHMLGADLFLKQVQIGMVVSSFNSA